MHTKVITVHSACPIHRPLVSILSQSQIQVPHPQHRHPLPLDAKIRKVGLKKCVLLDFNPLPINATF